VNFSKRVGRGILLAGLTLGLMMSSAHAQQVMQGRIWDFPSSHPDFETGRGGEVMPGQVQGDLGADGKPVWAGPANEVFSSPENFDQWYRDVPGVNLSKPYSLELIESPPGSGNYMIERYDFFPIDNELLGNEGDQFLDMKEQPRNFHYTMQLAGEFTFQNDTDHFTFIGDDDLWVFFGGRLGIDLGGTHRAQTVTITGAQLRELGLNPGQSYPIDIFFAERQSRGSNFVVQTNFNIQPPAPEHAPAGEEAHLTLPLPPGTEFVRGQRYWSPDGSHFVTVNPDGNLVVARADGGYVWGFDTQGVDFPRVGNVIFQDDGNLAAYAADGSYIWSALHENPDPISLLLLQPNGALQIATPDRVLWSSIPYDPAAEVADTAYRDILDAGGTPYGATTWSYSDEESWVEFAPLCGAEQQSPINIQTRKIVDIENGTGIVFEDREVSGRILFSGYGFEVNVSDQRLQAEFPELGTYLLQRVELHAPSEHRVDGKVFDAEQQMVFTQVDATGAEKIAVVCIMLTLNPDITEPVWFVGGEYVANLGALSNLEYVTYTGTLTAPRPDCLPGVSWFIQGSPYSIAPAEIDALRTAVGGDNARYYHQMDGRTVLRYRGG